jgi:hypothetical protein
MNKIKFSFFAFLAAALILSICCGRKDGTNEAQRKADKLIASVLNFDTQKAALLSMKYDIEAPVVEKLIENYNTTFNPLITDDFKTYINKMVEIDTASKYRAALTKMSDDLGIQKQIFASIIIDYEIWTNCEEASKRE